MLMVCLVGDSQVSSRDQAYQYTRIVKIAFILRASTAIRPGECGIVDISLREMKFRSRLRP